MRRIVAGGMVLGAMLVLAGCSSTPPALSKGEFLRQVHALPTFAVLGDAKLKSIAIEQCDYVRAHESDNLSPGYLMNLMQAVNRDEGTFPEVEFATFLALSVKTYCPEYSDRS